MVFRTALLVTGMIALFSGLAIAQPPEGQGRRGGSGRRGPSFERFANRFDTNKDGKITREEFTGRAEMFERFDTNKDGVITKSDLANMKMGNGRRRGGRGGEGRGGGFGGMFGSFPTSRPVPGQIAPNFELRTVDGELVSLGKLLYTRPVVLEFGSFT